MALSSVLPSVLPSLLPRCDQTRGDVRSSSSLGPQAPVLTRGEAGKWVSQGQKLPMGSPVLHSPRWLQGSLHTPWPGCHEPGEPESRGAHCSHSGGASAAGRLRSTEGTTWCAPCWPGESGGHIAGGPQQPSGLVLFRARDSGRTGGFSGGPGWAQLGGAARNSEKADGVCWGAVHGRPVAQPGQAPRPLVGGMAVAQSGGVLPSQHHPGWPVDASHGAVPRKPSRGAPGPLPKVGQGLSTHREGRGTFQAWDAFRPVALVHSRGNKRGKLSAREGTGSAAPPLGSSRVERGASRPCPAAAPQLHGLSGPGPGPAKGEAVLSDTVLL